MFWDPNLNFPTDWIQGGIFITLFSNEEGVPILDQWSRPICVYGDSGGYIMGVGNGTVSISWKWAMTDKEEKLKMDKYWTDPSSLGSLALVPDKTVYLEVPSKGLVFVKFRLQGNGISGEIVYLNKRPFGGYKVLIE